LEWVIVALFGFLIGSLVVIYLIVPEIYTKALLQQVVAVERYTLVGLLFCLAVVVFVGILIVGVMRHWRWLACSAFAVGCLLNPQPDLPTARPSGGNDGASGGSGPIVSGGAASSMAGSSAAGGPQTSPGSSGAGGTSAVDNEGGMGGVVELPGAGAPGESGQAGETQKPIVGPPP